MVPFYRVLTFVLPLLYRGIIVATAAQTAASPRVMMRKFPFCRSSSRPLFEGLGGKMWKKVLGLRSGSQLSVEPPSRYRVFLAVGSNLGDRHYNIATALELLCASNGTKLLRTSFLHHTSPMYVVDQPAFLNGAVELETELDPPSLLRKVKWVEDELGRNFSEVRNGPRPIDLDLLFYDRIHDPKSEDEKLSFSPLNVDTPTLVVPHPVMQEREFVLAPLREVAGEEYEHPVLNAPIGDLLRNLQTTSSGAEPSAFRVLCLPRGRMLYFNETIIMGILNITPDSFSDGGRWNSSVDVAVQRALEMEEQGAGIVDIGGESTRPGAKEVPTEEQIRRIVPIIHKIREISDIPISVDTRHAAVAKAAVEAGADIVNDVSGGTFDEKMLVTVAKLRVPIILMHMRGTPESMQAMTEYDDVVSEVARGMLDRSKAAEKAGIPRWQQVMDPGIGFAKNLEGNLSLLKHLAEIRTIVGNLPILLGTSRKGFLGKLTGVDDARERDYGTIGSCVSALCLGRGPIGCNILRVHNVKASKDAALVMDAIRSAK